MARIERAERFSPRWWVQDEHGKVVIAQAPNAALVVWLVCLVVGVVVPLSGAAAATVTAVGRGGLLAWALDELWRGASPFRRVAGALVLAFELVVLLRG